MTYSPQSSDRATPHGTISAYTNHGCRCLACATEWRRYMREYRRKNRDELNARRRAVRRARVYAATGEPYDFDELLEVERKRAGLT